MSIIRNVTVYTCDNTERFGHYGDTEGSAQVTVPADREGLPDGWVTVEGVGDESFSFCSLRCATSRLFEVERAEREAAERAVEAGAA